MSEKRKFEGQPFDSIYDVRGSIQQSVENKYSFHRIPKIIKSEQFNLKARSMQHSVTPEQDDVQQSKSMPDQKSDKEVADDQPSHTQKQLQYLRIWVTYIAAILQLVDFLLVYPKFKEKKFFPNQVVIVNETIVTIVVLLGCIYSKITG